MPVGAWCGPAPVDETAIGPFAQVIGQRERTAWPPDDTPDPQAV